MKIIAITTPKVTTTDALIIKSLLDKGIYSIHLRKPESTLEECKELLSQLSDAERAKIVVHDFPQLYEEFSLKGIHINKNVTNLPNGYQGFKTRSCHSFAEVIANKNHYDYLFLSPIFDSISKSDYHSNFSHDELLEASKSGVIDNRVIALGGVTFDKLPYLQSLHFGGVAMMGALDDVMPF